MRPLPETYRERIHPVLVQSTPELLALAALILAVLLAAVFLHSYNFDIWYYITTGNYILDNGIPHTNPFANQSDTMAFMVQQPLVCVIDYLIYSDFGFVGLAAWTTFLALIYFVSVLLLVRKVSQKCLGTAGSAFAALVALLASIVYINYCSAIYTTIIWCWLVYVLESYRITFKRYLLVFPVLLVLIHAQVHLSLALFDVFIVLAYALPAELGSVGGALSLRTFPEYAKKSVPVVACTILVFAALCANPYGVDGALYVVSSLDSAEYGNVIPEMLPYVPGERGLVFIFPILPVLFALALAMPAFAKNAKEVNLPLLLLSFVTMTMMFAHVRSCWVPAIFCVAFAASAIAMFHENREEETTGLRDEKLDVTDNGEALSKPFGAYYVALGVVVACGLCITTALCLEGISTIENAEHGDWQAPSALVDAMEKDWTVRVGTASDDEDVFECPDPLIFNEVRFGGYLEWRGHEVSLDSRIEAWDAEMNGEIEWYREYVDAFLDDTGELADNLLEDRQYDYAFVTDGNAFDRVLAESGEWELLGTTGMAKLYGETGR